MNRCLIFDMDGTLFDSREDIAKAVNNARLELGQSEYPLNTVVTFVGDGMKLLAKRAFDGIIDDEAGAELIKNYYAQCLTEKTLPYPGVIDTIKKLHEEGWKLAVFSNKLEFLCRDTLIHFKLDSFFLNVTGGDSGVPTKPDPDGIIRIMEKAGSSCETTWMCGDNWTDLEAAKRAGIKSIYASYGFGDIKNCYYDLKISEFSELLRLL